MKKIEILEKIGAGLAFISDLRDGDCSYHSDNNSGKENLLHQYGYSLDSLVLPPQIHSTNVLIVDIRDAGKGSGKCSEQLVACDGLITADKNIVLGITVADCVPIFLFNPEMGIAALLHAGREGTYTNICKRTVSIIRNHWGESAVAGLIAYIGPSAGPCCYEVSEEMVYKFRKAGLPCSQRYLNLWLSNRQLLNNAGLKSENIYSAEECTICSGKYHSYRVHKTGARNIALLAL